MKELKDGLTDFGADKDDYDSIIDFAKALEHPVKSSSGKVYVEIPNPEKTLSALKKVMKRMKQFFELYDGNKKSIQTRMVRVDFIL